MNYRENLPDGCHLSDIPGWDDENVVMRKCTKCGEITYTGDKYLEYDVCPKCGRVFNDDDYRDYEGESREDYDYDRRFD